LVGWLLITGTFIGILRDILTSMAVIKITEFDRLTQQFRLAHEHLAKCDICDPDADFPALRWDALRQLRDIMDAAVKAGYSEADISEHVIGSEEGCADLHLNE
jgi:hypothetical protein